MKHVGRMKNNDAPVVIVFRTLPGDPHSCLVVGPNGLDPTQHDSLMSMIETAEAQTAFELGNILSVRRFPDNTVMLNWLHGNNKLKKVATKDVIVVSAPQNTVPLDELNKMIAEQRGVSLEDLANQIDGGNKNAKSDPSKTTSASVNEEVEVAPVPAVPSLNEPLGDADLAKRFRGQAEAMLKEAQELQRQADELDPPKATKAKAPAKKKTTKEVA